MKKLDLDNVQEVGERLPAGGYICGITDATDDPSKECLKLTYDVAEGQYKNYFRQLSDAKGYWLGTFFRSYKETALPFFKGFVTAVENSNSGYKFQYNESTLKRKMIGLVLSEEEYLNNNGEQRVRLYVSDVHSVDKIRKGEYTVKELKRLAENATSAPRRAMKDNPSVEDEDLPF